MRKHIFGRQLKRDINERKALFKSLIAALVINESIQTTEAKAKAIKGEIDKMVTKVKKNSQEAERMLQAYFTPQILQKFIHDTAPRFANRAGGYTRIIKLATPRVRDNSKMVILEWVEKPVKAEVVSEPKPQTDTPKEIAAPKEEKKTKEPKKKEEKEKPAKKEAKKAKKE